MNKEIYRQQLIEKIDEKRQELQHRKERLKENMLAGVCNANKRTIGIATIFNEIANNYLKENAIWNYYS